MAFISNEQSCSSFVVPEFEEESIELFTCKYCNYQTANIEILDEHIITHDEAILEDCLTEEDNNLGSQSVGHTNDSYFSIISPNTSRRPRREHVKSPNQPMKHSVVPYKKSVDISQKRTVSVCPYCRYRSDNKLDMDVHLTQHSEPVEIPVYACSECSYTTIRKSDMTKHLLVHVKDGTGVKYECDHCSYTTIKKWCLQKHMLCHKQPDEVQMYPCSQCSYSTKRRSDLKKHLFTHPDIFMEGTSGTNLTIYRCSHCSYESIKKWCLQKHMFGHKNPEEVEKLCCDQCSYVTNRRNSIKKHKLTHEKTM